jgi:16S rRNA (uracil1498-N3)-methyltransferase
MPCYRYFYPESLSGPSLCLEDPQEVHHLRRVLRSQEGDEIELINGKGWLACGTITSLSKSRAEIEIKSCKQAAPCTRPVTLCLAVLKPSHLEYALEKATEVGAFGFELFFAEKSEKKEISPQYKTRLQEIVKNACKQCGRLYMPEIAIKQEIKECLEIPFDALFFGDVQGFKREMPTYQTACLFIGPESGFSKNEKELLILKKAKPLSFHPNTLRAETAAIIGTYTLFCHETVS